MEKNHILNHSPSLFDAPATKLLLLILSKLKFTRKIAIAIVIHFTVINDFKQLTNRASLTKHTWLFLNGIQKTIDAIFSVCFIDGKQDVNKQAGGIAV